MQTIVFTSLSYEELKDIISESVRAELKQFEHTIQRRLEGHESSGPEMLISKKGAAMLLGCSSGTVDNYARAGKLDRKYIGRGNRSVRFNRDQVLSLVESGKK